MSLAYHCVANAYLLLTLYSLEVRIGDARRMVFLVPDFLAVHGFKPGLLRARHPGPRFLLNLAVAGFEYGQDNRT